MERGRWLVRLADGREVLVRAERLETWAVLRSMLVFFETLFSTVQHQLTDFTDFPSQHNDIVVS